MINIYKKIGHTSLIRLKKFEKINNLKAKIYAKLEYENPFGSIKDRAALQIIHNAEKDNYLRENSTVIEATSGNMGIALAGICKIKGYKTKIVMPENMSNTRKQLIKDFGAELVLTPAKLGMNGAMEIVHKLISNFEDIYYTHQFNNHAGIEAHKYNTAPEISQQLEHKVDAIIAGIGTGATIMGIAEHFKVTNQSTEIIGVSPSTYPHQIQGIGAGINLPLLNLDYINSIIKVTDEEAFVEQENILKAENLFIGISSGAVLAGCRKLLKSPRYNNKNIVLIFADSGERYI